MATSGRPGARGSPHRHVTGGIELFVRLTPRAAADVIEGIGYGADGRAYLAARVRAVPEQGAANAALQALLAKQLGLPKRAITLVAGHTSRLKAVRIEGDATNLARSLAELADNAIGVRAERR
ncbi:MAG: DUF167 domain-containing protein [Rhizobiaceae bacterium]|nr:DUF167 domain-containing protein [Rhizobiaceae bacterium]